MDNKDLENKIQKSADGIETRDFSLVWGDIKHKVEPQKKRRLARWLPAVSAAACAVIACSIIIPLAMRNDSPISGGNVGMGGNTSVGIEGDVNDEVAGGMEGGANDETANDVEESETQTYFEDELITSVVSADEFFEQLALADIRILDIGKYTLASACLLKTEGQAVKGGRIELTDDLENPTVYLAVKFYDETVRRKAQDEMVYDLTHSVGGAFIEYRVKESNPDGGVYIYDIKANVDDVNYYMEYTCATEEITPFLDEFFK